MLDGTELVMEGAYGAVWHHRCKARIQHGKLYCRFSTDDYIEGVRCSNANNPPIPTPVDACYYRQNAC